MTENLTVRHHLSVLPVSYLHGRGEFFTTSFVRIDNGGFMQTELLRSSDPVFGVRVPLPQTLDVGKRYLLTFRFNPEYVEYILLGNRTVYERMPLPSMLETGIGGSEASMVRKFKGVQIRVIARETNPMVYFIRDRALSRWVETLQGKWRLALQGEEEGRHCSEWSEVDDELIMPLRIDVWVEPLCLGPEDIRAASQYQLPQGLRFWKGPKLYHKMPTNVASEIEPPAVEAVDYTTDEIMIIENDDFCDETKEPAFGSKIVEELESHLDLCNRYGVNAFSVGTAWTVFPDKLYQKKFIELLKSGKGKSIRYLVFTFGGPPMELELNEGFTRESCRTIREMLTELPDRVAVIRIMEINTNSQWPRPATIPPYLFPEKIYGKDLYYIENQLFIAKHKEYLEKIVDWIGYPERTEICFQDDGPVANPHWLETGMDYFITKNIWGFNTNVVQAFGRGFARAFGKPIGLAYDSHRGLDYEAVNPTDIEHTFRSYFFAGVQKIMYEAPFVGTDDQGVKKLTESGATFYRWVHWAKRHPSRGEEVIRIAYMKGSDDYGIRNPAPGPSRHGYRKRLLLHQHPAYRDWNLLSVAYPEFGNYEGSNPYRFLTGSPYGQADVVPYNAPLSHLSTFSILVMMGRNRLTAQSFESYLTFVRRGGKLVLALEHLLHEIPRERKYADLPLTELIGARLGRDINILPRDWEKLVPSTTCFYNQVEPAGSEVLETLNNGDPLLLRHRLGKGEVYFYTSEYLTSVNPESPRSLLTQLFAESSSVKLDPQNDWVQFFVRRRNGIIMLGLINHGQAGFPQGLGPKTGPWSGQVLFQCGGLGLDPKGTEVLHLDEEMQLHPVQSWIKEDKIVIDVDLDVWCEVILGPKGETADRLFERK